jgi:hypothetical protein
MHLIQVGSVLVGLVLVECIKLYFAEYRKSGVCTNTVEHPAAKNASAVGRGTDIDLH